MGAEGPQGPLWRTTDSPVVGHLTAILDQVSYQAVLSQAAAPPIHLITLIID